MSGVVDWLHAAELGVGADFLGQLLCSRSSTLARARRGFGRCGFASVKFRTRYPFEMKFDTLTVGMSNSPAPKPRAHGAEVWCWVPIANHMAREVLSDTDTVENSAKTAVDQLHKAYTCLSADAPFASDRLKAASHHVDCFRVTPKLHQRQDLCEMNVFRCPALKWTYYDETFRGFVVGMERRKGGKRHGEQLLNKIIARFTLRHLQWLWRGRTRRWSPYSRLRSCGGLPQTSGTGGRG